MNQPATFFEFSLLSPSAFDGELPIVRQEFGSGLKAELACPDIVFFR